MRNVICKFFAGSCEDKLTPSLCALTIQAAGCTNPYVLDECPKSCGECEGKLHFISFIHHLVIFSPVQLKEKNILTPLKERNHTKLSLLGY